MQWSDVVTRPAPKMLRQFAGLWLLVFGGSAAWRAFQGDVSTATQALAALAVLIGGLGLAYPPAMRWIFTGWMVLAFPIGWAVSRLMLAALFFLLFTPIAIVFRLMGRDALRLRRPATDSYWTAKAQPKNVRDYFRQS